MENKDLVLSWDDVYRDSLKLAKIISNEEIKFNAIAAITKGGLFPALIVAKYLKIDRVDTICLRSYKKREQGEVDIIKFPIMNLSQNWLIIDDLTDTGNTINEVNKFYKSIKNFYQPFSHYGVLYTKPAGHYVNHYVKKVEQNTWIVFPWE